MDMAKTDGSSRNLAVKEKSKSWCASKLAAAVLIMLATTVIQSPLAAEEKDIGMIYQLRIYEIFDRNKNAFHLRFRDHAARIMRTHGFDITSMWESSFEGKSEFIYIIRWHDEKEMKDSWRKFMADPEWIEIKSKTSFDSGQMVGSIQDRVLTPLDYSPGQWK